MIDKINEFLAEPLAQKVLFFNEMLTPQIIRLAYWLCLLAIVWSGLGKMFAGGFTSFLEGIVFIVMASILARVGAELIILFFKLNENMEQVANNTNAPKAVVGNVVKKTTTKVNKKTLNKKQ